MTFETLGLSPALLRTLGVGAEHGDPPQPG